MKVVTIGGGTGSFNTLRGLKKYPFDITAIVTIFDSGGSSGILRDEYGILPPGDIRRCLVALADETAETTLRELFNYRFDKNGCLQGHSFGNLLLTALSQQSKCYSEAIEKAAKILNCKGNVYPVSLGNAHICAELEDGNIVQGEANIDIPRHDPFIKIKKIYLTSEVEVFEKAKQAILEADVIIVGPGDVYTSIIPNLLVKGVVEALQQSPAKKVLICNLMTKLGETHGFVVSDFAREILAYAKLDKFDYIIANNKEIPTHLLKKYAEENKYPVEVDQKVKNYTHHLITTSIFNEADVLRHDSQKIADLISQLV